MPRPDCSVRILLVFSAVVNVKIFCDNEREKTYPDRVSSVRFALMDGIVVTGVVPTTFALLVWILFLTFRIIAENVKVVE